MALALLHIDTNQMDIFHSVNSEILTPSLCWCYLNIKGGETCNMFAYKVALLNSLIFISELFSYLKIHCSTRQLLNYIILVCAHF